jgi:hypothetical protein
MWISNYDMTNLHVKDSRERIKMVLHISTNISFEFFFSAPSKNVCLAACADKFPKLGVDWIWA